ncbi:MAG: IMP dehydrogenase [Candidatus Harrisonbacteria bacterium]|nr:IMP dehydrogenase [Candidatus Harrisonbacteria bacterium]
MNLEAAVRRYFKTKGLPLQPALTFADVAIKDNFSAIDSRSDIKNLKIRLAGEICLNMPIVSANMDTVTDSRMAIALARLGGLGFIHQFFSLEERIKEVAKVKRADNALIEDPVTILNTATLGEAKERMAEYKISSILVVDEFSRLWGILTSRDYRFQYDDGLLIEKIMSWMPLVIAAPNITRDEALKIMDKERIEKLPLIDNRGLLKGLITSKDILKEKEFLQAVRDRRGKLMVGAAVQLNADYLAEAEQLLKAGTDVILLDVARANAKRVKEAVQKIKSRFPKAPLVVGNIDTPEAALMLIQAGADCLKVGVGPGSACKTRETTGVGLPQLMAVVSCAAVAKKYGVSLIADGGIRSGANLAKAFVAGADAVMIGSLFAGTDESPGEIFQDEGRRWKMYRGSASAEHQFDRMESGSLDGMRTPEGVPRRIPYTGLVKSVVEELLGGLRSSMSYVGAHDLNEFWKLGKFVWQSRSGYEEGKPQS